MKKVLNKNYQNFFLYIAFFCLLLFLLFSLYVNMGGFLHIDIFVNEVFGGHFRGVFFIYSKILEYLYIFLSVLFFRLLFKFYKNGEKTEAVLLIITAVASVTGQFFVKPLFSILCPGSYYNSVFSTYKLFANSHFFQKIALNETCYPSNHTISYIVVCGYFAILMKSYFPKKKYTNITIFVLLFIASTVGITRIFLHVHWLSDVIAGYLLGIFFISCIYLVRINKKKLREFMKGIYEKLEQNTRK